MRHKLFMRDAIAYNIYIQNFSENQNKSIVITITNVLLPFAKTLELCPCFSNSFVFFFMHEYFCNGMYTSIVIRNASFYPRRSSALFVTADSCLYLSLRGALCLFWETSGKKMGMWTDSEFSPLPASSYLKERRQMSSPSYHAKRADFHGFTSYFH